uniref:Uncharacterized protein n=1 Tax=Octopus bimaculoides TaxID=37653 RepID=A0A0L8G9T5_OCTBM
MTEGDLYSLPFVFPLTSLRTSSPSAFPPHTLFLFAYLTSLSFTFSLSSPSFCIACKNLSFTNRPTLSLTSRCQYLSHLLFIRLRGTFYVCCIKILIF